MYKTDVSDYNTLKNQRDYSKIFKKYESQKLKTEPTELQKYYQYLTYQQPILDELNYVSERMKNEDIRTKTNDFNFIEDLRKKREELMKVNSKKERDEGIATLFEPEIKEEPDMTPTIITRLELENIEPRIKASGLFDDEDAGIYDIDLFGDIDYEKEPLTEEEKVGRRKAVKANNAREKIAAAIKKRPERALATKKAEEERDKFLKTKAAASRLLEGVREKQKNLKATEAERGELKKAKEAAVKIQKAARTKIETQKERDQLKKAKEAVVKIQRTAKATNLRKGIEERIRLRNVEKDFTDALSSATTVADKEKIENEFAVKRRGRPLGSKNKPKP
jgi:hypothetical protein